jgi:ABC-type transport system involved in multi-copper enzyme maturation permease subunit
MATGAHGVRFQYDYTHDRPGLPGAVTRSAPRWLRLTRAGDTITGLDSTDGTSWTRIGSTRLARLPATVDVGPFVTSPVSFRDSGGGAATQATARFDGVAVDGRVGGSDWHGASVGTGPNDYYTVLGRGGDHRSGTAFVVDGSGDIAAATNPLAGGDTESDSLWFGLLVALLVIVVVATMFVTSEYRRGLIRTTFSAVPARGSVLAAKAVVVGAAAFVVGAVAAAVAIPLGVHVLGVNGDYVFPAGALTEVQVVAGSGALLGLVAVTVVALAVILRSAAAAVSTGIAVFVLPYAVGMVASGSAGAWLLRLTPAAGFSVLGVLARSPLVDSAYTLANGYYPLAPWAGLAVLCAYAAAALWLAGLLLHRRDA